MPPSKFYSGDATADRRFDYARMLAEGGDMAAAAELTEQALELVPEWTSGWFRLGEYRDKAGNPDGAIAAYRHTLGLDPDDGFGASLRLALLGATETPDQPPSRYIESLFDDYADRFETALVKKLDYSVPGKLIMLVEPHAPFALAVDLGCGTGLFGAEVRRHSARLEGFDLSANMLAKAEQKAIYDHLGQSDLSLAPELSGLFGEDLADHRADLVSAADVLMYLGSLETVFPLVLQLLSPGGLFAFSIEDSGDEDGFVLLESMRYAHSEAYIRQLLDRYGLTFLSRTNTVIRMDAGNPIHGILFLSRKP